MFRVRVLHSGMPTMRYADRDTALLVARGLRRAVRSAGRHHPVVLDLVAP